MNPVLTGELGGGQSAAVKRREKLSALGGIGARGAMTRRNSVLLHGRVFITARSRLIGGLRFTAYFTDANDSQNSTPNRKAVQYYDLAMTAYTRYGLFNW